MQQVHLYAIIFLIHLNRSAPPWSLRVVVPFDLVSLANVLEPVLLKSHNDLFAHSGVSCIRFLISHYDSLKLLSLTFTNCWSDLYFRLPFVKLSFLLLFLSCSYSERKLNLIFEIFSVNIQNIVNMELCFGCLKRVFLLRGSLNIRPLYYIFFSCYKSVLYQIAHSDYDFYCLDCSE